MAICPQGTTEYVGPDPGLPTISWPVPCPALITELQSLGVSTAGVPSTGECCACLDGPVNDPSTVTTVVNCPGDSSGELLALGLVLGGVLTGAAYYFRKR